MLVNEVGAEQSSVAECYTYVLFQKLLERYDKCIASGGDYIEGD